MILPEAAIRIEKVRHKYGANIALDDLSMDIPSEQIFGLLGPNGSGKSTLFRLISTLVPLQSGSIEVFGNNVSHAADIVRSQIGVVFQSPSLDRKLTVLENMSCQAALYGLAGKAKTDRINQLLEWMRLEDKRNERCEKLSGGQKRRVELAKGLLHRPRVLILDEPSTGLDPSARLELWKALVRLKQEQHTTIVLTTHLIEEADKCDSIAILHRGRLVAMDSPEVLRGESKETVITIQSNEPETVKSILTEKFGWTSTVIDGRVRVTAAVSNTEVGEMVQATQAVALSVTIGRPNLEDVFVRKTGQHFDSRSVVV